MMEIEIQQDGPFVPVGRRVERHALIRLSAPTMESCVARAPLAISFVIDRSGSMAGDPLELACEATRHAISRLRDTDQFAIVLYDHEVEVLIPMSTACAGSRAAAAQKLRGVTARGTTDLAAGWDVGARLVAEARGDEEIFRRCLLLTDGMANEGVRDPDELKARAARWRRDGVTLTTMGLEHDFDEVLLGSLADAGGGALRYVRAASDLVKQFDEELGEALEVVARDVVLQVSCDDGANVTCLSPFDVQRGADRIEIMLGDLVSRQELVVLIEVAVAPRGEGDTVGCCAQVRTAKEQRELPEARAVWTAVSAQRDWETREASVVSVVVDHIVAATRETALEHNLGGDSDAVQRALEQGGSALEALEAEDLTGDARQALMEDQVSWSSPLPSEEAKEVYACSYSLRRSRSEDGSSRRR